MANSPITRAGSSGQGGARLVPAQEYGVLAEYPCDLHLARYTGPSTRVYLNIYREEQELKFKASVCGDCLAEICTYWVGRALHQAAAGQWEPPTDDSSLEGLWVDAGAASRPLNGRRRY